MPRFVSLIAIFLLTSQACFAQSEEAGSSSTKQYHVEVIAFQYQGPDSSGGESLDRLIVEEYLPEPAFDVDEYNRVQDVVSYTGFKQLGRALERLRASPQYSVLAASAWIQPLLSEREAVDVPLAGEAASSGDSQQGLSRRSAAPRLQGSVRIYGGQLLFVDMDIRAALPRRQSGGPVAGQRVDASGDRETGVGRAPLDDGLESYRISETRRIKLDEIHYFDHPFIGAVLSVTRNE